MRPRTVSDLILCRTRSAPHAVSLSSRVTATAQPNLPTANKCSSPLARPPPVFSPTLRTSLLNSGSRGQSSSLQILKQQAHGQLSPI